MNIRVLTINDYLFAFYDGRPAEGSVPAQAPTWADLDIDVGVATYVIHRGDKALVFDTFPTIEEAQWVRDYLVKLGIRHFTVVNSHWHLDHTGGNAVYADSDRIGTKKTYDQLMADKSAIEAGTEWGSPAVNPLVPPNILITATTTYAVGDIQVELRPINIHTADGLVAYLPKDRILLAADTMEDTLTFVNEPDQIPDQIRNLLDMRRWNIDRIFPDHGNPAVIADGGYHTTFIDATVDYLHRLVSKAHEPGFAEGSMESYVGDSVAKGWVSYWWAYRDAHKANLAAVQKEYGHRPLPPLPPLSSATVPNSALPTASAHATP
jgi:glyoxylase-like metal-dependent hydrolase (beta-lactamase superfamily II)